MQWLKFARKAEPQPKKTDNKYIGPAMRLEDIYTPSLLIPVDDGNNSTELADIDTTPAFDTDVLNQDTIFSEPASVDDIDATDSTPPPLDVDAVDIADEELEDIPFITDIETEDTTAETLEQSEITANQSAIEPLENVEPVSLDEPLENVEPVSLDEPAENVEPVSLDEPAENVEPVSLDEPIENVEPLSLDEPAENVEFVSVDEPVEEISSADEIDTVITSETDSETLALAIDNSSETTDTNAESETEETSEPVIAEIETPPPAIDFDLGSFTVGETGEIGIDFLFDGGGYKGQIAIISLEGMEKFEWGTSEFFKEAANRALSNSELGYLIISDVSEGARFSAELGEANQNEGAYLGVKTFAMRAGDKFGFMLVPNGTVQQVFDNPNAGGWLRPLFSMATANPNDAYHIGQMADVTGDGNTFALEDMRVDGWTDKDYNDIVFQVRGATGKAVLMDDVVAANKDWRDTDMGVALIEYAKTYITPEMPVDEIESSLEDLMSELEELMNNSDNYDADVTSPAPLPEIEKPVSDLAENSADVSSPAPLPEIEKPVSDLAENSADVSSPAPLPEIEKPVSDITENSGDVSSPAPLPEIEKPVSDLAENSADVTSPAPLPEIEKPVSDITENSGDVSSPAPLPEIEKPVSDITENSGDVTEPESSAPQRDLSKVVKYPIFDSSEVSENNADFTKPESPTIPAIEKPVSDITEVAENSAEVNSPVSPITAEEAPTEKTENDLSGGNSEALKREIQDTETSGISEAQPVNFVKTELINRLENLTQNLNIQATEAPAMGGKPVSQSLIFQVETITQNLKNSGNLTTVPANTIALIERLENLVVKSMPVVIEPSVPQFEFAKTDQPLVGVINEIGFNADSPKIDYSRITLGQDRVEGDTNPLVSAGASETPASSVLETINSINDDAPMVVGRGSGASEDWAKSLIEYVDTARASGQPNAIVNLSLNLTQINQNGGVVPRYELTATERAAIAYAQKHNVIIVASAGDKAGEMSALGQLSGEFDNVITVGAATRVNDAVALSKAYAASPNSGSGGALDIVAEAGTGGTVEASAKVTGAISQVWAANSQLNFTQIIDILKRTATDLGTPNWDMFTGAGLLNIAAAVSLAKATEPEPYTVKPGQQTITDNFISQGNPAKELPGDPTHPAVTPPGIGQTNIDTGANSIGEATQLLPSATVDVIDQVSGIDPTDIYRVDSRYLAGAEFSVLTGELSVSYLTPSGQVLGTQVLTKGSHKLQLPADAQGEVIVKIDAQNSNPASYVLYGFESTATEPFNIDLEFETPLTASQQALFSAAAKSVASLIGKGLPSAVVDGKIIDDINIKISTASLDGSGGTQAQTKIDFMRYGSLLPAQSLVQFDGADIAELEKSGQLFSVVQHEFLHALGFGNLWEAKGLVDYAGTPLAQYNGKQAVDAFKDLGGLTDAISLETQGDGSAGLHWNEMLFKDEVMTYDLGFKTGADGQVFSPISTVTIASLADLGYQVNLDRATPDFGLFGGERFNADQLTPEQIEAFRKLAEESLASQEGEFIPAIMPEVDPAKVAPEIWAHAEKFWKNNEYYDWVDYQIQPGDTLSGLALRYLGNSGYDYYKWIGDYNGVRNYDYIVAWEWIKVPVWHPNYEWEQEQERLRREEELRRQQEEEARIRREQEEAFAREQERVRQEEEARRLEAERQQRELEEQERRLREEMERRRQEEEWRKEQERLAELVRQAEIARQQGKGGLDWYLAKPLSFGNADPFEINLGDVVGNLVPDDYYRFTLSRGGRLTAELKQLLADADLVLYDARNKPIAYSMREGITDEQIITDLIPGTYMLRVNSPKGVTTDYDLIVKFQHKLSMTQQGPPPGWQVGGSAGGAGGAGGGAGSIFSDPRIKQIYDTALNNFAAAERAKANAQIAQLEAEKLSYEEQLQALLDQMNAEQRAKIYAALDGVRNQGQGWVNDRANDIKGGIDKSADWVLGLIDGAIPSQVYKIPGMGDAIRSGRDSLKGAINGARSWLKDRVSDVQNGINTAISGFVEGLKNAYMTGAEINSAIERLAQDLKSNIDRQVSNLNNWVDQFKGQVLGGLGFLRNVGVDIPDIKDFWGNTLISGFKWNFYDNVVAPLADKLANPVKDTVTSGGNFLKGAVDFVKPLAQGAVADIVSALLGDETGHLYNQIHGIDQQIANIKAGVEKTITAAGQYILNVARQIETLLTDPEERKRVLDALFRRGYKTAEDALNFVKEKLPEVRQQIQQELVNAAEEARKLAEKTIRNMVDSLLPPGGTDTKTSVSVKDGIGIAGEFGIGGVGVKKAGDKILERENKNGQITYYVSQEMLAGITGEIGPDQGLEFDLPGTNADIKSKGKATVTGEFNFALGVKYQFNPETPGDMFKLATLLFSDYIVEGILPPQQGLIVNDLVNRLLIQNLHSVKPAVGLEVEGKVDLPTFQAALKAGIKGSVTMEQNPPKHEWSLEASLAGNVELGSILGWTTAGEGKITASVKQDAISNHIDEVAMEIAFAGGANSLSELGLLLDEYSSKQLSTAIIGAAETELKRASLLNKKMQGYKVKFTLTNPGETFAPLSSIIKQLENGEQPNFSMIRDLVNTISSFNENKEVDVWAIESDELALKIEGTVVAVEAEISASVTSATERQIG